ncbi:DMT family transporter [bacterium]|jgi:drug/metabolite transporter (DMT)-like permease|nr:DMT family transporter [Verrucomicrobiales bacterium]MDC3255003.1 DMT family transporter [bacterium]MDF1785476.1 DMT family transporter [Verrucomicrobiales bacterium]
MVYQSMHLIFPLISSLLYVAAAMFFKQAASRGVGPWRTALVCNGLTGVAFLALWPLGGSIPGISSLWQPVVVAGLFVGGQLLTFLALDKGDVSVATPVIGIKLILVAVFTTWLLATPVRSSLWLAAALSVVGIAFLHRGPQGGQGQVGQTILFALAAGVTYALFDVLVMKWAPAWGPGRFLPIAMLLSGVLSLGFVPLFSQPLRSISRQQWRPLLGGSFFMAAQAMVLINTLAVFQDGTAVNVIYNLRGLWSVAAVWFVGHWFGNVERQLGRETLGWRLAGAVVLSAAVVLVFV